MMMMRRAWLTSLGADLPSRLFSSPSAWQISWGGDGKKLMIRNFWAALFLVPFGLHEKHT